MLITSSTNKDTNVAHIWRLAVILIVGSHLLCPAEANRVEDLLSKLGIGHKTIDGDYLNPLEFFLQDIVPPLFLKQRANNENGSRVEYREYNLKDSSNDDAMRLTGHQLMLRSGYKYTVHDAVADDGYITQVTHLINPLADRTKLRQPPILLAHGGTIDPTCYIIASSIQHFPEKWPRSLGDGPMRSWNRSLAFMLANNGFDVWMAETRGANEQNRRHIKDKAMQSVLEGKNKAKNMTAGEEVNTVLHQWNYWSFSIDDIIAHELKSHIDTVLNLTGSDKLSLLTFSLSTPSSLSFLGLRPDYARKVHGYVAMAPIISGEGVTGFTKFFFQRICPLLPEPVGTLLISDTFLTQPTRELMTIVFRNRRLRYGLGRVLVQYVMGSSGKWQALMDLNFLGHMLRSLSFKQMKQMCQQTKSNKLQKYDYGPIKNKLIYNSTEPPVYNISNLQIKDWIIVSGANDQLSTRQVIDHLYKVVNPKPIAWVVAPGFNHIDLVSGWENDKYINIPIMKYFEKMSYPRGVTSDPYAEQGPARTIEVQKTMIPAYASFFNSTGVGGSEPNKYKNIPTTPAPIPVKLYKKVTKGIVSLLPGIGWFGFGKKEPPTTTTTTTTKGPTLIRQQQQQQQQTGPIQLPMPNEQFGGYVIDNATSEASTSSLQSNITVESSVSSSTSSLTSRDRPTSAEMMTKSGPELELRQQQLEQQQPQERVIVT